MSTALSLLGKLEPEEADTTEQRQAREAERIKAESRARTERIIAKAWPLETDQTLH